MNCSVPGCKTPPGDEPVRTKATPATDFEPGMRVAALTHLCPTHRTEFEKLGWLAPAEEEDET